MVPSEDLDTVVAAARNQLFGGLRGGHLLLLTSKEGARPVLLNVE